MPYGDGYENPVAGMAQFVIKDSGERETFAGGMQRDTTEDKLDYLLVRDGPMFERWVIHLNEGAKKYSKRNWMLGIDDEAYDRFRQSAARHFEQWLAGQRDEDHAAATFFNINGAERLYESKLSAYVPDTSS